MKAERGFTLLEVMFALAVFAALAAAVLSASQLVLRQGLRLEERVLGTWVLDNRLQELRMQPDQLDASGGGAVQMGGRRWRVEQRVGHMADRGLWHVELRAHGEGIGASEHWLEAWVPET